MNSMDESLISNCQKNLESWHDLFAEKLLSENFLLTALEFHAELTESGKELSKLRDFFSNPRNFEQQAPSKAELVQSAYLPRSSSQATLDSLDLTRYSEDGERNSEDRVAVLEFELRKARETINSLRVNLTEATESETSKGRLQEENLRESQSYSKGAVSIKPHEQRALNFLINEYLLSNGYKLTSITFADENESQDFEDWDDVGLNSARPLELLQLYREGLKNSGFSSYAETKDFECQVTLYDEIQQTLHINELETQITELVAKINSLNAEISKLSFVEKQETAERVSERSLTPDQEYFEIIDAVKNQEESETKSDESGGEWTNLIDRSKKESSDSRSGEQLNLESVCKDNKIESPVAVFEVMNGNKSILKAFKKSENICESNTNETSTEIKSKNEMTTGCFNTAFESSDKTDLPKFKEKISCEDVLSAVCIGREKFENAILKYCDIIVPTFSNNNILSYWFFKAGLTDLTFEHLIQVLSETLPKIIPNIILNKREEVTPLLILSICFNTDLSVRDNLLNLLFNLKKKPDVEERKVILEALLVIAKLKGSSMVENEILPQCWEQITHKYVERRMLVAESCFLLAPYVSETIRNSLILSITHQLLQDREETVRKASINILTILIALISDDNKYCQILEMCLELLSDKSILVINLANQLLFPTLAKWSFTLNKIQSDLFYKLLCKLKKDKNLFVFHVLKILLPYLVMTVANSEFLLHYSSSNHPSPAKRQEFFNLCKGLCDPALFFEGSVSKVLAVFDSYTSQPDFEISEWHEMEWIMQVFVPDLIEIGDDSWEDSNVLKGLISILKYLCLGLGRNVITYRVKPFLLEKLIECENAVVSGQECKYSIISLYLVGVLSTYPEELQEMSNTLRRFICALPLCGVSFIPLQVTVEILSQYQPWQILVLDAIWEGVVHQRPLVRSCAAVLLHSIVPYISSALLSTKVMPALVTLTSDPETSVRTSAVPALGMLMVSCKEKVIKDKVYMTFQTLLQDSISLENHSLIMELVKSVTFFYDQCDPKFRDEVIVPQLFAMTTVASKAKSKDLVEVLVDAFSAVTYCQTQLSSHCAFNAVLPGLRNLENVCSQSTLPYAEHVDALIKEVERRFSLSKENPAKLPSMSQTKRNPEPNPEAKRIAAIVSPQIVVEDVRNRVTKIFSARPNTLHNVSGIFKKKT